MMSSCLEFLVRSYMKQGDYIPNELNDSQLSFIADNWEEVKTPIFRIVSEKNFDGFANVEHALKDLKEKKNVPLVDYLQKEIYPVLLEQKRFSELGMLSSKVNIAPTHEQLLELWSTFFEDDWNSYRLKSLVEDVGKPILAQKQIDKIGNDWLAVQAGEKKCKGTELMQPGEIREFLEIAGKSPDWNRDLAQRVYDNWLGFHFHDKLFTFLQDEIGIKPNKTRLQRYYAALLSGKEHARVEFIQKELETAVGVTGILPYVGSVQRFYKKVLDHGNYEDIKKVETLTGVKLEEGHIHHRYNQFLRKGFSDKINLLRNKTGVDPRFGDEIIQESYFRLIRKGEVKSAIRLYLFTDVDPKVDSKSVKGSCERLIKDFEKPGSQLSFTDVLEQYQWLVFHFPKPSTELIHNYVRTLFSKGKFQIGEYILNHLKIEPLADEKYVLACQKANWKVAKSIYEDHKDRIEQKYPDYAKIMEYV